MSQNVNKANRIYSLDSLRAIMMMLGVVLHSTETYIIGENAPFAKDQFATHISLNYLENIIHMFRIPIFFIMAGFFGALLFYDRNPMGMIKNRVSRIVFPFVVFLFILAPMVNFALLYSNSVFDGTENAFSVVLSKFSNFDAILPQMTYHLWFLYYLIFTTFVAVVLAITLKKTPYITEKMTRFFNWVMNRPIFRIFFFTILIFILLLVIWDLSAPTPLSFTPDIKSFIFYFFFYIMGWLLFKSKDLLNSMMRFDWLFTISAIGLFTFRFIMSDSIDDIIQGVISALIISMFIFGITGLFIRYFSANSLQMRYMSDSSYWVYLVHIPFAILIPALIADFDLPGIVKFLITFIMTTIICFITYHYLVRSTFIGKFLNGRKYSIKKIKNRVA